MLEEHLDRLDPDCLEFDEFDLSAGRHKPFTFDPTMYRAPEELVEELDAVHADIRKRLRDLLTMVAESK